MVNLEGIIIHINYVRKKDFYPPNTRQCLNITVDQYNKLKEKQIGIRTNE